MPLVLAAPAAAEPLSLAEAKSHLRVDGSDEDALISGLIATATLHVERDLGIALITQGWKFLRDAWPPNWFTEIPLAPLQSVESITVYDADDAAQVFGANHWFADLASSPPRVVLRGSAPWPVPGRRANGVEIALTAGFGLSAADVPQPLRHALLLLVAHWYERREPVLVGEPPHQLPGSIAALLAPYRRVRL
ncbi:MAG: hypothetical protein D6773_03100 [Alphaproteobacteria bacterium]|nr:MAG: hypothetical protein D6773_03100 [Alphaproteobacteria bacterium]